MNALVIGGNGGIGRALLEGLSERGEYDRIHATWHNSEPAWSGAAVSWHQLDVTDEDSMQSLAAALGDVDLCINAVGMLHDASFTPEKATRHINTDYFLKSMTVNTLPTLLLAKHLGKCFRHGRQAHFATVSARVGSIGENYLGGWYSYRASKAALNQVLKTLSIEWKRSLPNVIVSALHPGTTDTALSAPFQKNLPAGQLFEPAKTAGYLLDVLDSLTPEQSGGFWSFDGERLPW